MPVLEPKISKYQKLGSIRTETLLAEPCKAKWFAKMTGRNDNFIRLITLSQSHYICLAENAHQILSQDEFVELNLGS